MIEVREVTQDRNKLCEDLLRTLPAWFGIEGAIRQYALDVDHLPMLGAFAGERPVGFVSLKCHNPWTAEVHVMAIHPDFHRRGIGRALLAAAESRLRGEKYSFLSVKTLSPSHPSKEYEKTRDFYFATGFRPVEEFKTLWGASNPCLLMIKTL